MRCAAILIVAFLVLSGCKSSGESDLDAHNAGTPQQPADNDNNNDDDADTCTVVSEKNEQQARAYYESDVYPVLRGDCLACHVQGGDAAKTSFVLSGDVADDYALVKALTEREIAGYPYLLAKATAIAGHTAGVRFNLDSPEADVIRHFSDLLKGKIEEPQKCVDDDDAVGDTVEDGFLKGVTLLDNGRTLNKAAMIMLGRRATAVEEYAVSNGSEESLRSTLRWMMQGPEFTEFLMTAANDQLLTDKFKSGIPLLNKAYETSYYRFAEIDWPGLMPMPGTSEDDAFNDALASEPLALIAYIVNNERDYREVLTANYTVFNALTYKFFDHEKDGFVKLLNPETGGAAPPPTSANDWVAGQFSPGVGTGYYMDGNRSRHPAAISYPHAGVLTTLPWLARWPNTNTNGQRKRAKMILLQFLGYDIEATASRPMDQDALADSANPVFSNPACTGCHRQLDPLAGAFQNWGYTGRFRLNDDGEFRSFLTYPRTDALNEGYKSESVERCGASLGQGGYCDGDLWYADRFPIGFVRQGDSDITQMPDDGVGRNGPHDNESLRWMANQLVSDPRFATGTVEFWYEAVFNQKPLTPPTEGDPGYDEKLRAYVAQQELIHQVAEVLKKDNGHGAFNLKDLLVELLVSDWFRASAIEAVEGRDVELASVGVGSLLTPEQLDKKIESVTGIAWKPNGTSQRALMGDYNVIYGGIDSDTVVERTRQLNPLMISVMERMVSEMACEVVYHEFIADRDVTLKPYEDPMQLKPRYERWLFEAYSGQTPDEEQSIKKILVRLHKTFWNDGAAELSEEVENSFQLFKEFWQYEADVNDERMRCVSNRFKTVVPLDPDTGKPVYAPEAMRTWRDMIAYFMSAPEFLFE